MDYKISKFVSMAANRAFILSTWLNALYAFFSFHFFLAWVTF